MPVRADWLEPNPDPHEKLVQMLERRRFAARAMQDSELHCAVEDEIVGDPALEPHLGVGSEMSSSAGPFSSPPAAAASRAPARVGTSEVATSLLASIPR